MPDIDFSDLVPKAKATASAPDFSDLVPKKSAKTGVDFSDLVPQNPDQRATAQGAPSLSQRYTASEQFMPMGERIGLGYEVHDPHGADLARKEYQAGEEFKRFAQANPFQSKVISGIEGVGAGTPIGEGGVTRLAAGARSALGKGSYEDELAKQRGVAEAARETNPMSYWSTAVPTGLFSPAPAFKAQQLGWLGKGAGVGAGAATGAGLGGVYGALQSRDLTKPRDVADAAVHGAVPGALLGGLLGGAGRLDRAGDMTGEEQQWLARTLLQNRGQVRSEDIRRMQKANAAPPVPGVQPGTYAEQDALRRMYRYGEGDSAHGASEAEQKYFDEHIRPFVEEHGSRFEALQRTRGRVPGEDIGEPFMHRPVMGSTPAYEGALAGERTAPYWAGGSKGQPQPYWTGQRSLGSRPPTTKERAFYKIDEPTELSQAQIAARTPSPMPGGGFAPGATPVAQQQGYRSPQKGPVSGNPPPANFGYRNMRRPDHNPTNAPIPPWFDKVDGYLKDLSKKFNMPQRISFWTGDDSLKNAAGEYGAGGVTSNTGHLLVNSYLTEPQAVATAGHEFGHQIDFQKLYRATGEQITDIRRQWGEDRNKFQYGAEQKTMGQLRPLTTGQRVKSQAGRIETGNYMHSFQEWWAEQVSRFLTQKAEPITVADKFFAGLAKDWERIYNETKGYLPLRMGPEEFLKKNWEGEASGAAGAMPEHMKVMADLAQKRGLIAMSDNPSFPYYNVKGGQFSPEHRPPPINVASNVNEYQYGALLDVGGGEVGQIRHALTREIEKETAKAGAIPTGGYQYHDNAWMAALEGHRQATNALINAKTVKEILENPITQKYTAPAGALTREQKAAGWAETKVPEFSGIAMSPRMKNTIDDMFRLVDSKDPNYLEKINKVFLDGLFRIPFPHVENVGVHAFQGRGWANFTPSGMRAWAETAPKAAREVWTQGPVYKDIMAKGGQLFYGPVKSAPFNEAIAQRAGFDIQKNWEKWSPFFKLWGIKQARQGWDAWGDWSQRALWGMGDVFAVQRVLELERNGMSRSQAIEEAEKFIPNYYIPDEVLGSRGLRTAMASPAFVFSPYHYGRLRAYGEVAKRLYSGKTPEMLDAAGHLAATLFLADVMYPLASYAIDHGLGEGKGAFYPGPNDKKGWQKTMRGGLWTLPALQKYYGKGGDWTELANLMAGNIMLSPGVNVVAPLWNQGRDLFTGRPIASDTGAQGVAQGADWLAGQYYPGQLVEQGFNRSKDESTPAAAARTGARALIGASMPTSSQEAAAQRAGRMAEKAKRRRNARPKGVLETLSSEGSR